ncbi:MAG: glutamine-hydrolyzing GMP synthase, partial [Thermodesulfovibrio sp.]|nr:glutamine-hydrolyzing GMP synthase [Thermodesulfovibrio sp.]
MIIILDFGSQYTQLIARRIRELGVYCEIYPYSSLHHSSSKRDDTELEIYKDIKGVILSGGPDSVYEKNSPKIDYASISYFLDRKIPILGICYGMQLLVYILKGKVTKGKIHEYGLSKIKLNKNSILFSKVPEESIVWMSHGDTISQLPEGFDIVAITDNNLIAAAEDVKRCIYLLQFHPEVKHTQYGIEILKNFVFDICGAVANWQMESFVETSISEIKNVVKEEPLICAISGGVDSSVAATLVYKAVGKNLYCVFVDNGLLRYGEKERVEKIFRPIFKNNLYIVDAQKIFLSKL